MAQLRFVLRRILKGALALVVFLFIVYLVVGSLIRRVGMSGSHTMKRRSAAFGQAT